MKQIFQSLQDGSVSIEESPVPKVRPNHMLIQNEVSLISAGTERVLLDFGKAGWIGKARQQPEKVRMVLDKVRTDGLFETLDAVRSKIDTPQTPGYCAVGVVVDSGCSSDDLKPGTRVVSNGSHAQYVCVPRTLCAAIPDNVSDETASFAVLGAIGLQGMRLAQPSIGEVVVVYGLGLIGLLTVQMLVANGCRVLGVDLSKERCQLAESYGAQVIQADEQIDVVAEAIRFSRGRGVDAVILTVSTKSNDPVSQAAQMCRKRGRIVLVGVTGLDLNRSDLYEKEISLQVSCSYGPGRYDPVYEELGQDYPIGYVRWTEQRNFEAVLDLMSTGSIDVSSLITHRYDLEDGEKAMELLTSSDPSLGILLVHNVQSKVDKEKSSVKLPSDSYIGTTGSAESFIGAGHYASRTLIPAFKKSGANLQTIVSGGGASAVHLGKKFGFKAASTEANTVFDDVKTHGVVIATRHDQHARQITQALNAGKHVFCEKPLCLRLAEVDSLEALNSEKKLYLMVGYNRRYAPLVKRMKSLLKGFSAPKSMIFTVNSGSIPGDHWTQDPQIGGGRLVGEACHFIDLARFFANSAITSCLVSPLTQKSYNLPSDTATIDLAFEDGSTASIHYFSNGNRGYPKERIEIFTDGRILQLDNFKSLKTYGFNRPFTEWTWRQDKGQTACVTAFLKALQGDPSDLIPSNELFEVARIAIKAQQNV